MTTVVIKMGYPNPSSEELGISIREVAFKTVIEDESSFHACVE
jgi:hypothetical protein